MNKKMGMIGIFVSIVLGTEVLIKKQKAKMVEIEKLYREGHKVWLMKK